MINRGVNPLVVGCNGKMGYELGNLSELNLENLPKMIRTKLYNSLSIFKDLRTLILGSGSGGWLADVYSEKFAIGLPYMKNLVHLSLKYDCNSYFLHTLTETCKDTLRILDIEFSKQVQDDSVNYIKDLQYLLKINIFRTGLTIQGQVRNQLDSISNFSRIRE